MISDGGDPSLLRWHAAELSAMSLQIGTLPRREAIEDETFHMAARARALADAHLNDLCRERSEPAKASAMLLVGCELGEADGHETHLKASGDSLP
jgi:hypothetical protein